MKWEYLEMQNPTESWMNEKGEQGWELVCVIGGMSMVRTAYFKRPLL